MNMKKKTKKEKPAKVKKEKPVKVKKPEQPQASIQSNAAPTANTPVENNQVSFCPECGTKLPAGSAFCQNCGYKVK